MTRGDSEPPKDGKGVLGLMMQAVTMVTAIAAILLTLMKDDRQLAERLAIIECRLKINASCRD